MAGWIKLHRKFLHWEWYDDINTKILFIHLLLTANHKNKKWHNVPVKRGQILTSVAELASLTGLTTRAIRTSLLKLSTTNEVTSETTNKYTILTIVKYEEYQYEEKQTTNKTTNKTQTSDKQTTSKMVNIPEASEGIGILETTNISKEKKERSKKESHLNINFNNLKDLDLKNIKNIEFNVDNFLTDLDRECCKAEAPGWDLYALITTFNVYVNRREVPKYPAKAFLQWVIKFTKGKAP